MRIISQPTLAFVIAACLAFSSCAGHRDTQNSPTPGKQIAKTRTGTTPKPTALSKPAVSSKPAVLSKPTAFSKPTVFSKLTIFSKTTGFSFASLLPGPRVKVVQVRKKDLKELPTGRERALAFENQRKRGLWFFGGPVDFKEPTLPEPGSELDGSLLPPRIP